MLLTSFLHLPDAITKMRDGKKASFFHPKPPAANNAASSHPPHSLYHIMLTQSPCLLSVCLPMSLGDQKAVPQSFASPHLSWTPLLQWDHIGRAASKSHLPNARVNRSLPRNSHPSSSHPKRSERKEGRAIFPLTLAICYRKRERTPFTIEARL